MMLQLFTINVLFNHSDLCRPDVRHESAASLSLANMRLTVVTACARSIEYMTSVSAWDGLVLCVLACACVYVCSNCGRNYFVFAMLMLIAAR